MASFAFLKKERGEGGTFRFASERGFQTMRSEEEVRRGKFIVKGFGDLFSSI